MDIVEISEENVEDFLPVIGEDLADDIKRVYYNGIGAVDQSGRAAGAFVYELLNSESEEDTQSRICFLKSEDKATEDSLKAYYSNTSVGEEDVVESFYELEDESIARALEEVGFSLGKKEDDTITLTLGEISASGLGKKRKLPSYVGNIEGLSILQFREAVKQILFKGHKGLLEDIPFLPKSWFDDRVSACISSGGKIPGLFLIRRNPSGTLIPVMYFAFGPEYQKNLIFMLQYSIQQALELYPPETTIKICRKSSATRRLTNRLLPDRSGAEIFCGIRKEQ